MNRDFVEMLSALSAEGVEYVVVGANALAVHGVPRATGDLDILVRPSPENAARVLAALGRFGAPLHDLTAEDLKNPGTVFQVGLPPSRLGLMTSIDGVGFDEARDSRVERDLDGLRVPFLGREALLRNKRATGRTRDLADVEALEQGSSPGRENS